MIAYENPDKENWFLVSWTLSNKCNYRCSYCPDHLHNGSTGQPEWNTVERFIKKFSVPGKKLCYRISGGEPTHFKHFMDMAKLIKDQGHSFSFMTNGSQSVEYYKDISKYCDGIIISYHPEYANTNHIIDISNSVSCPVALNLMLVPNQFQTILEIAENIFIKTNTLAIWPKVILDKSDPNYITNKPAEYSESQLELLKNWPYFRKLDDSKLHRGNILLDGVKTDANELLLKGLNRHKNWKCYGGIDMINIDMWGNVYRSDCKNGGALGNIERYHLPTIPIICEMDSCNCLSDIYLRKQRG
jgi:organic radical activating enzyme